MAGNGVRDSKSGFYFLLLVFMLLVKLSIQLRLNHPAREVVDRINHGGPYIGLVLAFPFEERPLQASGLFVPNSEFPAVELSGRKFNVGKMRGVNVIYVVTGEKTVNAAITVEILLQAFDIKGIVHYGIAGCTNPSFNVGDVGVLEYTAFTSSWKWTEFGTTDKGEFNFGTYNLPSPGKNLLAELQFQPVQLFTNGKPMQELFWFPADPHWYNLATKLKGVKLERCLNETACLPSEPKLIFGLRGSTADVFLANEAYAKFLHKQLNISTADEESAAVLMTSLSNGVPCVIFRGLSDVAGREHLSLADFSKLAALNAFRVADKFIQFFAHRRALL